MVDLAATARLWALTLATAATWAVAAYQCRTDVGLGPAVRAEKKGIALDDSTLRWCSSQIPERWPNADEPMTSVRIFKAWDPLWNDLDRTNAWANLEAYVVNTNAKVFIGTQITCDEDDDVRAWGWTKELIQRLHPEHVMGLAIGNELELLQYKGLNLVPQSCIDKIWEHGYLWRQYQRFTAEFDSMGFGAVPVTSVFTGLGLGGLGDVPFYEKKGQARVNSFIENATRLHGSRFAFTWNFYPYFDPNFHLDEGTTDQCKKTLAHAVCLTADCNVPRLVREARTRQRWMTGTASGLLWIGEMGWSSPMSSTLKTRMKDCEAWSAPETFRSFYELFLGWDMDIGSDLAPPDHVFWFTMRDALNFGSNEHFGLISTCDEPSCKVRSAGYEPQQYSPYDGPGQHYCGDDALYDGWTRGEEHCQAKCTLEARCIYYSIWPRSHGSHHWCRLTTTCNRRELTDYSGVMTLRKAKGSKRTTTTALPRPDPTTAAPTRQVTSPPTTELPRPQDPIEPSTTEVATTQPSIPVKATTAQVRTTTTRPSATLAPTTAAPTTAAPTTVAPTTAAPSTAAPTTAAPTTAAPTTAAPTTRAPTTGAPTTAAPTTRAPSTGAPATGAPTTRVTTTRGTGSPGSPPPATTAPSQPRDPIVEPPPTTRAPATTTAAASFVATTTLGVPSQAASTTQAPSTQPAAHAGHCEFENMPLFPGFFWDPSCKLGMLGCNADGINVQCRFCGGGSYSNISCPHTSCTFVHEPFVPYYWDETCHAGMEGCWADGVHAQCRFCGRFPFTSIPCPAAPAPPASETSAAACTFDNMPETPVFVDESCRHGMKGCLADSVHMSCRFCGEGPYADIACPEGPAAERCSFAAEPTTPYYWDPGCHMGMLGCMADGVHPQCRFCAQRPFEGIPCPESPYAPPKDKCRFPSGSEPQVAHYWEPDCAMGVLGCWADGIHAECRFCGSDAFRNVSCPGAAAAAAAPASTSTAAPASTSPTSRPPAEEAAKLEAPRMPAPTLVLPPSEGQPAQDLAGQAVLDSGNSTPSEDEIESGAPRLASLSLGIALVCWLGGRF